jgi:hypothetical protein
MRVSLQELSALLNPKSKVRRAQRSDFLSEYRLVLSFEQLLRASNVRGNTGFLREFDAGSGIADFILYTLRPNFSTNLRIGHVHPKYLYALRRLPLKKNFTLAAFARRILGSKANAHRLLDSFKALGFCKNTKRKNMWRKTRQPQPILRHLCAVEAKLTDWRRALRQANRYCEFADQAWVLLDYRALRPALENLDLFVKFNIGLAGFTSDTKLEIHFAPEIRAPRNPLRYWQANAQIAAILAKQ